MQDPNEDTEWNDVLRAKGILPAKQKEAEVTEGQIQNMVDAAIKKKTDLRPGDAERLEKIQFMSIEELDDLEDSEDEEVIEQYRRRRIAEIRALAEKSKFGSVREISGKDYVDEVNKAGEDIWVVLHLYANGVPMCAIVHDRMEQLAIRYPQTKFLRSVAKTCIPNFPEKNLPTVFVYFEGSMVKQFIGPLELRGENLTVDELEYMLGKVGAVPTEITEDPRPQIRDKMLADLEDRSVDYF